MSATILNFPVSTITPAEAGEIVDRSMLAAMTNTLRDDYHRVVAAQKNCVPGGAVERALDRLGNRLVDEIDLLDHVANELEGI